MNELLTVKQVAELLQLHEMTIRRYIRAGKLEAVRVGRRIRVPRAEVESLMSSKAEGSGAVLREPAVVYYVGEAAPVKVVPPTVEQIQADYIALDDEGRMNAGNHLAQLREKQAREKRAERLLKEARQLALERVDWPREKVWEHFEAAMERARQQMIENGTAFDGDWIGD